MEAAPHKAAARSPTITKTIQIRGTRHVGLCWRSKDELIRDVILWTPSHGRAKAGRPVQTYIQQLCADTGSSPENLPKAMDDGVLYSLIDPTKNIIKDNEQTSLNEPKHTSL